MSFIGFVSSFLVRPCWERDGRYGFVASRVRKSGYGRKSEMKRRSEIDVLERTLTLLLCLR